MKLLIASQQTVLPLPGIAPSPRRPVDQRVALSYFARIRQVVEAAREIKPYEHRQKAGQS